MTKKGSIPWNKGKKGLQSAWNKGKTGIYSEETKWLMGAKNKGIHRSSKTEFKKGIYIGFGFKSGITPWNKGKTFPQFSGKNHFKWKGNDVGYSALHDWVAYYLGNPQKCDFCARTDKKVYHWANKSGEYKRDLADWLRLCVSCHREYDKRRKLPA